MFKLTYVPNSVGDTIPCTDFGGFNRDDYVVIENYDNLDDALARAYAI